jgi:hypothetical protein
VAGRLDAAIASYRTVLSLAPGGAPSELFAYLWRSHFHARSAGTRLIEQQGIAYAKNIAGGR